MAEDVGGGTLTAAELKALSAQLKSIAETADDAANFAARVDKRWAYAVAEAQTFVRRLAEDNELTKDERMFADAIQTCCNTVLKRLRVHNLHLEEPGLPTVEQWDKATLQPWLLSDLRRICVSYELVAVDTVRVCVLATP
jgi:hypothetical protein